MLEIGYKHELQLIEVRMISRLELWPEIRTVFEENATEISHTGPFSLRIPVWSFLSCRKALGYILDKYQLPFNVDDEVRSFLQKAKINENDYETSAKCKLITVDQLIYKLREVGFIRDLTEHQIRNVIKLVSLHSGATFSVPGAGKTTEALAFYYYKKTHDSKLLVVCPKNAFAAWEEQLNLCIKEPPKIIRLSGGKKIIRESIKSSAEIFLITYQQLSIVRNVLGNFIFNNPMFMFLDESHRIKRGSEGQWCNAVLSLSHLPVSKLVMSGTPLPNSIADLIPQFNFLFPEVRTDSDNIKTLIKPIFVRTTKGELGLPQVKRIETIINMLPMQRHLYELIRSEEARSLSNLNAKNRMKYRHIGTSVMRLLQLVSNPALLAKKEIGLPDELFNAFLEGDSPKIQYACYKARKLAQQGKKTIIWSNFVENVETISLRLSDLGADYIHGGVEAGTDEEENTREKKILRFHKDPRAFVLVANPAACAEGISLHTVCHHAIYVDRNYNAAQYLQSEDRIHRLGLPQDTITTIEILTSPDTIDDSIKRRLNYKVQKMAEILDDHSLNIELISDVESDGIDNDDIKDFLNHLRRK